MFSIGVLGDMPSTRSAGTTPSTGSGGGLFYNPDPAAAGLDATSRIVELLQAKYSSPDFPVALLLALSLQPPTSVTERTLDALKECTLKGKLWKEEASALTQAYAALALGRIGTNAYANTMLNAMSARGIDNNVKRSAAIGVGLLGQRVDGAARAALATSLLKEIESSKDASVKNFGIISLAYLIEADVMAKKTDVVEAKGKPAEFLLKAAEDASVIQRPFAALALAIIGRAIGDKSDIAAYGKLRMDAIETLKAGVTSQKMDKRARAAFAVSLGIIRDTSSKAKLTEIVADKQEDKELRGYAAVGLGMIGEPTPDVVKAIRDAMKERSSEELRLQTATALGFLGTPDAVQTLIDELNNADTQNVQGQIVVALSKIGDAKAIAPLVEMLRNKDKPDLTRALACAGLGLVGDLELIPALARIRKDINYRAAPNAVAEVLTIL
jgi:HEAT repeat protein